MKYSDSVRFLPAALVAAVAILMTVPPARTAGAQTCMDGWRRPVACDLEVRWSRDGRNWRDLRPGRALEIPVGERVELEVRAEDQFGWSFPRERLLLGLDLDRECEDRLTVKEMDDGRYRISAGPRRGRCRAILWVPGNLNLERALVFEVRSRARTGYEWEQARHVARALYLALLGREPDRVGWDAATAEIQRGRLDSQVRAMVHSPEFLKRRRSMTASEILTSLYHGLLRREPDTAGVRTYLRDVERGRIDDVVLDMVRSVEFEERMLHDTRLHAMH